MRTGLPADVTRLRPLLLATTAAADDEVSAAADPRLELEVEALEFGVLALGLLALNVHRGEEATTDAGLLVMYQAFEDCETGYRDEDI